MKKSGRSSSALLWMSGVTGKAKINIVILVVVQAALGVSSVGYAMLLREIVNSAVAGEKSGFFLHVAMFAGLVLFQVALRAVNRFFEEFTRSDLENRFKSRLLSSILTKDYSRVTQVHSGEWMNRLTSDTVVVADGLTLILPGVVGMAVKLAGALAAILWLEPKFMYILIPGGALMLAIATFFRKYMKQLHKRIQEADGRLRIFMSERIGSLMIVRTFAREKQSSREADALMGAHRAARMRRNNFSNVCNIGFGIAMNGLYVLGAAFCGYGILVGTMSYGNLTAVLQLVSQIQSPFANITGYLPKYYAMLASAERLAEAEKFDDDVTGYISDDERVRFYEKEFYGIELKDVSFKYEPISSSDDGNSMPIVLQDLNISIKKGEYVAFTGPSGCGKSTVLKLLLSLYPVDSGKIALLTNSGETELDASWRGLFAYVPQGNQLMSGTIREIIAFGDSERMQDESGLKQAITVSCADEFIAELKNGIDTVLGERGTGLSEGQMQRIAIARAVFSNHPILLLDEATSALDEATEEKVLSNLRNLTEKTVIVVTHRPAALEVCDKQIDFEVKG